MEKGPRFLADKYGLHNDPEVEKAARRKEARTGERVQGDTESQIQNYLDRFKEIVEREDPADRERGLTAVKRILYREYVIDSDTAAEQYINIQKKVAREQGHGDLEVPPRLEQEIKQATLDLLKGKDPEEVLRDFLNEQKQLVEEIVALVEEQKRSLDGWVDYLASPDATYPDWLKYWAIRSITQLSAYNKDKKAFPKRTTTTINAFPDLNREALAYVLDAVEKKYREKKAELTNLDTNEQKEFANLLNSENFAKLYAWALEKVIPASEELLANIKGEWQKYDKGSDSMPLVRSIQGHGTGWCTAGETTAESQLSRGDFYVYYSQDEQGKPNIPRAAIRMEENRIAEVRGIAHEQNLDSYIAPVVEEKMKEFPDGEAYQKKARDMKALTLVDRKVKAGRELSREDLIFLYEINSPIEGFGYQKDPRIAELRSQRVPEQDMLIVFECEPSQVARNISEVGPDTRAYVGRLEQGVFDHITKYGIEHVYTSFPENRIRREQIEIGSKTAEELERELEKQKINVSEYARDMLQSRDFQTSKNPERVDLVLLKVKDLGLSGYPATDQIYKRAEELGLELCPAETGPHYRLQYQNQPLDEWLNIAMKQITDRFGRSCVFCLERRGDGLWLRDGWADPDGKWSPDREFVFRLRKSGS